LFAVDVLGWQDLEDLLRRHRDVLDWYLGDRGLKEDMPGAYRCMAPAREPFVERGCTFFVPFSPLFPQTP